MNAASIIAERGYMYPITWNATFQRQPTITSTTEECCILIIVLLVKKTNFPLGSKLTALTTLKPFHYRKDSSSSQDRYLILVEFVSPACRTSTNTSLGLFTMFHLGMDTQEQSKYVTNELHRIGSTGHAIIYPSEAASLIES